MDGVTTPAHQTNRTAAPPVCRPAQSLQERLSGVSRRLLPPNGPSVGSFQLGHFLAQSSRLFHPYTGAWKRDSRLLERVTERFFVQFELEGRDGCPCFIITYRFSIANLVAPKNREWVVVLRTRNEILTIGVSDMLLCLVYKI